MSKRIIARKYNPPRHERVKEVVLSDDCQTCKNSSICAHKYRYSEWKARIYPVETKCVEHRSLLDGMLD